MGLRFRYLQSTLRLSNESLWFYGFAISTTLASFVIGPFRARARQTPHPPRSLYFIMESLVQTFYMLKYGIAAVLVLIGQRGKTGSPREYCCYYGAAAPLSATTDAAIMMVVTVTNSVMMLLPLVILVMFLLIFTGNVQSVMQLRGTSYSVQQYLLQAVCMKAQAALLAVAGHLQLRNVCDDHLDLCSQCCIFVSQIALCFHRGMT